MEVPQTGKIDITTFTLSNYQSVGVPSAHTTSLELYRDGVVLPSLERLDAQITAFQAEDDPSAIFAVDMYAELYQSTVEGYLLTVQSMWERGVRNMLATRAKAQGFDDKNIKRMRRSTWDASASEGLQQYFLNLMGLPMQTFDTYNDLELLHIIGNALRHGDGASAEKLHQLCPNLWFGWIAPGETLQAGPFCITGGSDGPKHPSIINITLKETVLYQMLKSVLWFWEDVEMIRCNSFSAKAPPVERELERWKSERGQRASERVWEPHERL